MNVFMDLEFTGLHKNTELISIGLVAENGKTFYAESKNFKQGFITVGDLDFFSKQVNPNLKFYSDDDNNSMRVVHEDATTVYGDNAEIRVALEEWFKDLEEPSYGNIKIIGDVCTFDWVVFCDLWNHALKIPDCVYYIPIDVATLLPVHGFDPDHSREYFASDELKAMDGKHNALYDAKVIKCMYDDLLSRKILPKDWYPY